MSDDDRSAWPGLGTVDHRRELLPVQTPGFVARVPKVARVVSSTRRRKGVFFLHLLPQRCRYRVLPPTCRQATEACEGPAAAFDGTQVQMVTGRTEVQIVGQVAIPIAEDVQDRASK